MNRALPAANKLGPKGNRRPDVLIQTKDGKIHQVEVSSKTDDPKKLRMRMEDTLSKFPEDMRGEVDVIEPLRSTKP